MIGIKDTSPHFLNMKIYSSNVAIDIPQTRTNVKHNNLHIHMYIYKFIHPTGKLIERKKMSKINVAYYINYI